MAKAKAKAKKAPRKAAPKVKAKPKKVAPKAKPKKAAPKKAKPAKKVAAPKAKAKPRKPAPKPKARPAAPAAPRRTVPVRRPTHVERAATRSGVKLTGDATTTLLQTVELPGPPEAVYAAYVNADLHAAFTGAPAALEAVVGGLMSAWDGYITGTFERLDAGRRIVQTWRTLEWPDGFEASRLELSLSPAEGGTRVTMVHAGVPTEQAVRYDEGWRDHYWEPLRRWLLVDHG